MPKSKEQAQADLAEFEPILREAQKSALAEYLNDQLGKRHKFSKRGEATLINDYTITALRERFRSHPRMKIIDRRGTTIFCVDGYAIKAKKFDRNLRTRYIATDAVLEFLRQQPQLEGMPDEPTNLFLGYQKREVELTTSPIYLVCPLRNKAVSWDWPLTDPVSKDESPKAEAPAPAEEPAREALKKRLTPKRTDSEEPSEGEAEREKKE